MPPISIPQNHSFWGRAFFYRVWALAARFVAGGALRESRLATAAGFQSVWEKPDFNPTSHLDFLVLSPPQPAAYQHNQSESNQIKPVCKSNQIQVNPTESNQIKVAHLSTVPTSWSWC
jgi:hypothetical protein